MRFNKYTSKEVKKWLVKNGFDCGCRLGNEFLYEPTDNYIMIQKNYDSYWDSDFIKCLRKLGLKNDFDCSTLSILHELGHFNTKESFTEEEWDCDNIYKMFLSSTIKDEHELNRKYWECDTEKVANKWLVKYVKNNPQSVSELESIIETTMY